MKLYHAVSVSLFLAFGVLQSGCETFCAKCYCDNVDAQNLVLNEPVQMKFGEVYCNPEYRITIAFDSLYGDGRCPTGVWCVWEGNAQVHFALNDKKEGASEFVLNTFDNFLTDTVIHGLRYELVGLDPYPDIEVDYPQEVYIATVLISE